MTIRSVEHESNLPLTELDFDESDGVRSVEVYRTDGTHPNGMISAAVLDGTKIVAKGVYR